MPNRIYVAIDLKSFYASVECKERNLDPLTTNLVVADASRTEKTICLAVSPSLKTFGVKSRPRLFEVIQKVKEVNNQRLKESGQSAFKEASYNYRKLKDPKIKVDYLVAKPRMALYMEYSTKIFNIYQRYVSAEDIHVYSIDEVFIDITGYLQVYNMTPKQLVLKMIQDVLKETGITATAGIGMNLFLAKVAMDIVAKHRKADKDGVRIALLDEMRYRKLLWEHRPLTDFWRIGKGYSNKLEANGLYTMGDIALCSLENEDKLYKLFGINAELLIDHAWGYEPCTMQDIKAYKPSAKSIGTGQVLSCAYTVEKGKLIVKEMAESLSLDLVNQKYLTKQLVLTIGYDIDNLKPDHKYQGEVKIDGYGRKIPRSSHGTIHLDRYTSSTKIIVENMVCLMKQIVDENLLIRRINMAAINLIREEELKNTPTFTQIDLFTDINALELEEKRMNQFLKKEKKIQKTIIQIKEKYGKNAIFKAMDLGEGATTMKRNSEIGGHNA